MHVSPGIDNSRALSSLDQITPHVNSRASRESGEALRHEALQGRVIHKTTYHIVSVDYIRKKHQMYLPWLQRSLRASRVLIIVLMVATFLPHYISYHTASITRFFLGCQSFQLENDILEKLGGKFASVDIYQLIRWSLVDVVISAEVAQRVPGYSGGVSQSHVSVARKLMVLLRSPHYLVDDEIGRGDIFELLCEQVQHDQASQGLSSCVVWELRRSHTSEIHALHIAVEDLRFMLSEVDWLVDATSPARRACGFQKFGTFDEKLSMDNEALLVGLLASEDFESIFEVVSVSVSDIRNLPRALEVIPGTLSRRRCVHHVGVVGLVSMSACQWWCCNLV